MLCCYTFDESVSTWNLDRIIIKRKIIVLGGGRGGGHLTSKDGVFMHVWADIQKWRKYMGNSR